MTTRLTETLSVLDPVLHAAMQAEERRQDDNLELIASENYTSYAVMAAQGSALTNKYAEGYPGKRYYAGCVYVDQVEQLAIDRLKALYGAEHANVQPHSGSQANQSVFYTVLKPGDAVLGMSLSDGGHLTHGASINISGRVFRALAYGVNPQTGLIDYDQVRAIALRERPRLIIAGASSYTRIIDWAFFAALAREIDAVFMADIAHYAGLIAAKQYPSPVGLADFVTSTTHKTLRGPRGGIVMTTAAHAKALDSTIFPGMQGGPLMHVIAGKAVCFQEAAHPSFTTYQAQVLANARAMASVFLAHDLPLVAGGTDCHMVLLDVRPFGLNGRQAEDLLLTVGITLNRNTIPGDPEKPWVASGIRIGTPALTTRGMGVAEATWIAEAIVQVLSSPTDTGLHATMRQAVLELCHAYLPYPRD